MDILQGLRQHRDSHLAHTPDSPLKKHDSHDNSTAQTLRFLQAKSTLSDQISKCDQLFQRVNHFSLNNPKPLQRHATLFQKQFQNIYSTSEKHRPSLIAYSEDVRVILQGNQTVCLRQATGRSELFQLVIGLSALNVLEQDNTNIILYTSRETLNHYHYFSSRGSATLPNLEGGHQDSDTHNLQGIVTEIRLFEDTNLPKDTDSNALVVLDLFSEPRSLFRPQYDLIVKNKWYKNLLIYTHIGQDYPCDESVELNNRFPCEIVKDNKLNDIIRNILDESKLYAQRFDLVVFSPTPDTQKGLLSDALKNTNHNPQLLTGIQEYNVNTNNIFIASSQQELAKWWYPYRNVVAILDYGIQSRIVFDIEERVHVETVEEISQREMDLRLSFLGEMKPGKYFQMFDWRPKDKKILCGEELSLYILAMITLGHPIDSITEGQEPEVKTKLQNTIALLKTLNIISVDGNKGNIINKSIHRYSVSPFFSKMMLELKGDAVLSNIMAYIIGITMTPGTLKKTMNKNVHQIWKKATELYSYLEILYVYELETEKVKKGEGNILLGNTESFNQSEFQLFGNLFQEWKPKPKLLLSEMSLPTLIAQLDINPSYLFRCLENVRRIRTDFQLQFVEYSCIEDKAPAAIDLIMRTLDNVALYTGSRRFGYRIVRSGKNYQPSKNSLMTLFNERHNILLPLKLLGQNDKPKEIMISTRIPEEAYINVIGDMPVCSQKSSFSDVQVEFTGVSNAMFEALFNNTQFIESFEKKHTCMVQPNQDIASIIIFCPKQARDVIEKEFTDFLDKTKKELEMETKVTHYNNLQLVFQKGGSIRELLNKNDSRVINLVNIPANSTDEEIKEMLEEYADLEKIEIKMDTKTNTKVASITFCSIGDLGWVREQLDHTEFNGKKITFEKPDFNIDDNRLTINRAIKFKWYACPLTKKGVGIVVFKTVDGAKKAQEVFTQPFDKKDVIAKVEQRRLHLLGLNEKTDEIYLKSRLSVCGEIEDIQLEKAPIQESNNAESMIDYLIKEHTSPQERFHLEYINKMSEGLRVAKVTMHNPQFIIQLCNALNETLGHLGKTRLYLQPQYIHPILVPNKRMLKLHQELLQKAIDEFRIDRNTLGVQVVEVGKNSYIVLKCNNIDTINLIVNYLNDNLREIQLELSSADKEIFFTEIGVQILDRLEELYTCKFVVSAHLKTVGLISKQEDFQKIYSELISVPEMVLNDNVVCSLKTYKILCKNPGKLEEIKDKNQLKAIKIDNVGKSIQMTGMPLNLRNARVSILYYIESIHSEAHDGISSEVCAICCEELNRPYRLQLCGHAFCEECLMFSINNAFGDVSCFPIKCPHCLTEVAIRDLANLLDPTAWVKLTNIAVNNFVFKNADQYAFCFSPNCRGIYHAKEQTFECQVCQKSYCSLCKTDPHKGLTCSEAKDDMVGLLKKYMKENDVRICPNPACKMLMQRIDGCYRVTCSRCNQSICWKCPADSMLIFATAEECYAHLTDKHGGYW